jgi:hypothetical protein
MFSHTCRDLSSHVHDTVVNINQSWASNPALELLPVAPTEEPGFVSSITVHLMLVPP